jgi:hypothetical protein
MKSRELKSKSTGKQKLKSNPKSKKVIKSKSFGAKVPNNPPNVGKDNKGVSVYGKGVRVPRSEKQTFSNKPLRRISAEDLGGMLSGIHAHTDDEHGYIIYYEADVIRLLKKLGHPAPKWGISLEIGAYRFKPAKNTVPVNKKKNLIKSGK